MSRDGYERASIASIARAAELSPGLVHYHFANKEAILFAVIEQLRQGVRARYEARLDHAVDPMDRLLAYVDAHVALGKDAEPRAVAAWVTIAAEAVGQPGVRELYAAAVREALAELRELVGNCLKHAGKPRRDTRAMAAAILSAIEGAYQLSAAAPDVLPSGFAAPALRKMIRGLLA